MGRLVLSEGHEVGRKRCCLIYETQGTIPRSKVRDNRSGLHVTLPVRDLPYTLPKGIIFDIGRVIVRLNLNRASESFASAVSTPNGVVATQELSAGQMWTEIQGDPRWIEWQEGRMTSQEWYEHITGKLRVALSYEEFCAAWNSVLDPEIMLPDDLFAQLAVRCRLGLLSNTDAIHVAYLEHHFPFLRHFPVRIYSNEVGASKPARAIYQAALAELDVTPAEALYIDDIAEYAETARQMGLDAIHFENPEQLLHELSQRGLIPG